MNSTPSALHLALPRVCLRRRNIRSEVTSVGGGVSDCLTCKVFRRCGSSVVLLRHARGSNGIHLNLINTVSLRTCSCGRNSGDLIETARTAITSHVPPQLGVHRGTTIRFPRVVVLVSSPSGDMVRPLTNGYNETICSFSVVRGNNRTGNCLIDRRRRTRISSTLTDLGRGYRVLFTVNSNGRSLTATGRRCRGLGERGPSGSFSGRPTECTLYRVMGLRDPTLRFRTVRHVIANVGQDSVVTSVFTAIGVSRRSSERNF